MNDKEKEEAPQRPRMDTSSLEEETKEMTKTSSTDIGDSLFLSNMKDDYSQNSKDPEDKDIYLQDIKVPEFFPYHSYLAKERKKQKYKNKSVDIFLRLFSHAIWDRIYLFLLCLYSILSPLSEHVIILQQYNRKYLVLMTLITFIPISGAILYRLLNAKAINNTSIDIRRFWSLFFVLTVRSLAYPIPIGNLIRLLRREKVAPKQNLFQNNNKSNSELSTIDDSDSESEYDDECQDRNNDETEDIENNVRNEGEEEEENDHSDEEEEKDGEGDVNPSRPPVTRYYQKEFVGKKTFISWTCRVCNTFNERQKFKDGSKKEWDHHIQGVPIEGTRLTRTTAKCYQKPIHNTCKKCFTPWNYRPTKSAERFMLPAYEGGQYKPKRPKFKPEPKLPFKEEMIKQSKKMLHLVYERFILKHRYSDDTKAMILYSYHPKQKLSNDYELEDKKRSEYNPTIKYNRLRLRIGQPIECCYSRNQHDPAIIAHIYNKYMVDVQFDSGELAKYVPIKYVRGRPIYQQEGYIQFGSFLLLCILVFTPLFSSVSYTKGYWKIVYNDIVHDDDDGVNTLFHSNVVSAYPIVCMGTICSFLYLVALHLQMIYMWYDLLPVPLLHVLKLTMIFVGPNYILPFCFLMPLLNFSERGLWIATFVPYFLYILPASLWLYLVKPAYAACFLLLSAPFVLFLLLLSLKVDLQLDTMPWFIVLVPMYVFLAMIVALHLLLPYIGDHELSKMYTVFDAIGCPCFKTKEPEEEIPEEKGEETTNQPENKR